MFGLNMGGCGCWSINSYAEAVRFFERCPTRRGSTSDEDPRFIRGKEGSRVMDIRMVRGSVRFRYHTTDVVVWLPGDSYVVDLTYNSASTCTFANRFVPDGHYSDRQGKRHVVGDWAYPGEGRIGVSADGTVDCAKRVFSRYVVNRAKTVQVLKESGFNEYHAWRKLMWPMVRDNLPPIHQRERIPTKFLVDYLRDPSRWHALMVSDITHHSLRTTLYTLGGAYVRTCEPRLRASLSSRTINKWEVGYP